LGNNLEQQINVTDNVSYAVRGHQIKFGVDYRRLEPEQHAAGSAQYVFASLGNVIANNMVEAFVISRRPAALVFPNWSLFAQDTWKLTARLTMTYGLRWEYNPAPSAADGPQPFTVNEVNDLSTMALAPEGTPLWRAQKHDFAPRLGIAWQPFPKLVFRAGAGIFYDFGYSLIAGVAGAFPYGQQKLILPAIKGAVLPLHSR
jgi:outer membrane receptor protein involved in Fe transport